MLITAAAVAIVPAAANAGPHDVEIAAVIERAEADWAVILSCSVPDPEFHTRAVDWLAQEWADIQPLLIQAEVAPDVIDKIGIRLSLERLMRPTEGTTAELIAFCGERPDWQRQFSLFQMSWPAIEVRRVVGP